MTKAPFANPGWAGNTGDFELTESEIRGSDFVGERPKSGGHASGAGAMPFMFRRREPDSEIFRGEYLERIEKVVSRYPDKRAALLAALSIVQEIRGHVGHADMREVAELLDLPTAHVRGVATFYTMYNKRPVGLNLVQVCTNISCSLMGADEVFRGFLDHIGVQPGETSDDGEFTVVEAECLAACGFATCVQINSRYYENVSAEDIPDIVAHLRSGGGE
ncbi:MAG: NAD(P)H-dependent oxidoreductase subunit E [Gemmatimonadetes bacterium]|nr:NAD(P)H-dependent oxidoreductase subunit E [Gemmatimonadota bacterium]